MSTLSPKKPSAPMRHEPASTGGSTPDRICLLKHFVKTARTAHSVPGRFSYGAGS
jgi:hypothetical protein